MDINNHIVLRYNLVISNSRPQTYVYLVYTIYTHNIYCILIFTLPVLYATMNIRRHPFFDETVPVNLEKAAVLIIALLCIKKGNFLCQIGANLKKRNGRDLTELLNNTPRALMPTESTKKGSDNTKNATKNFDYATISDRLRTVSWSHYSYTTRRS